MQTRERPAQVRQVRVNGEPPGGVTAAAGPPRSSALGEVGPRGPPRGQNSKSSADPGRTQGRCRCRGTRAQGHTDVVGLPGPTSPGPQERTCCPQPASAATAQRDPPAPTGTPAPPSPLPTRSHVLPVASAAATTSHVHTPSVPRAPVSITPAAGCRVRGHGRTRQGVRPSRPGPPGPTFLGLPRVLLTPLLGTGPPDSTRVPRAGGSAHGSLQRFHVAQVGAPARGLPGTQPPLWAQPLPSPLTSDPEHAAALPEHPGEARGGGIRGAPAQLGALRFQGPGGGGAAARFTSPAANGRLSVGQGAGGAPGCPAGRAEGVSRRL